MRSFFREKNRVMHVDSAILFQKVVDRLLMAAHSPHTIYDPKVPYAIMISGGAFPKTMEDLSASHKDPTYELVSGAREAYFVKKLAGTLARNVTESGDVRNLASLIQDAARELERSWRMAACISNVPVSTAHPYLPVMPHAPASGEAATGSSSDNPAASQNANLASTVKQGASTAGPSQSSKVVTAELPTSLISAFPFSPISSVNNSLFRSFI
jgi:hypothetical protein